MKTLLDWFLLTIGILYFIALYFVWLNRGSEKVVTTAGLGFVGLASALVAVMIFGAKPPIKASFPSAFLIKSSDQSPYELPPMLWGQRYAYGPLEAQQLLKDRPEIRKQLDGPAGATFYHHLLQKEILEWINAKYISSWEVEVTPIGIGGVIGESTCPAGPIDPAQTILSSDQVRDTLRGNLFASNPGPLPGVKFSLPPRTSLRVTPLHKTADGRDISEIEIKNRFCTVKIETQNSMWMRGIGGYQALLGLPEAANNELATTAYTVRIEATFSRILAGHPYMPRYVKWADDITQGLQNQFDEQIIWNRARDQYLFWKQVS